MIDTTDIGSPDTGSARIGDRWGRLIARQRWIVAAVWVLLALASALMYPSLQNGLVGVNFSVPGTDSSRADELVERHFASFGSEQVVVTFSSESES
ncbi:MAG: hypothetical protein WBD41_12210 [Rhodococcus sp. (in: high G+C Gram-positive bacteria)]